MLVELTELNHLRLERDLSYSALAREVGLTPSYLCKLLGGQVEKPWDRTIYRIRKYLEANGVELAA